jgi:alanine-glyoxylate transaminase/serine-glyoxylate transaminase/serine-pyruvate transaminase
MVGTLDGVEMGLELAGVPSRAGGTQAAMDFLAQSAKSARVERGEQA